ncbi:MAG: glutamate racemase [Pseudomonadota bacterium]
MMASAAPRVLLFDSGIGGLSIAAAIWARLPGVDLVYAGDNAGFPYGDLSEHSVVTRCLALVEAALAQHPCDLVVVACNTASTVVLPTLRARLAVPVVGVVPAIKPAAALSRTRRIGVLATPATVDRPYLWSLIDEYAADCTILRLGSSELVRLAEAGLAREEGIDDESVRRVLQPLAEGDPDTVVLGCTHFPLIGDTLARVMPGVTHWVDSGEAVARRVDQLLGAGADEEPRHGSGDCQFLFTAQPPSGLSRWLAVNQPGGLEREPQISRVSLNTARNSNMGSAGL